MELTIWQTEAHTALGTSACAFGASSTVSAAARTRKQSVYAFGPLVIAGSGLRPNTGGLMNGNDHSQRPLGLHGGHG